MGLLKIFDRSRTVTLRRLPSGSFTVDRQGGVLASTLPQSFPVSLAEGIGREMLAIFRSAAETQLPLNEIIAEYSSLKLTARELRGGVIVFLAPRGLAGK